MAPSPTLMPQALRERIAMVRVLCIGFMIYVHVPDNAMSTATGAIAPLSSLLFQGFLVEGVGRASAALLSLVSGLLTAIALSRSGPASLYRRRFRSIIVPMLLWSTLTVVLYALLTSVQPTFLTQGDRTLPELLLFYVNAMVFLTEQPMGPTLHLGFLRDLFVCILLAPVLLAALRRFGAFVPIALGALYLLDVESVVMLRPLVLFAFSIGLWLAIGGARLDALDGLWPLWVVLSVLATLAVMLSATDWALGSAPSVWFAERGLDLRETLVYPASRLFGGLALWTLAAKLVGTRWNRILARLSPYIFVAFCSHFLVLTFLWEGLVRPLVGARDTLGYALWFAIAPLVAMGVAALIVETLARLLPPLAGLLTGGRVSTPTVFWESRPSGVVREPSRGGADAPLVTAFPAVGKRRTSVPERKEVALEGAPGEEG